MIFDNVKNSELYCCNSDFKKAFDFIERAVNENLPIGKYEIEGTRIFASIQEYTTKSPEEALFEGHRKYIDVQYLISGEENIFVVDVSKTNLVKEYDENIEAAFFDCDAGYCTAALSKGDFCIFYPHDIHKPGLVLEKKCNVKKIVVKLAV